MAGGEVNSPVNLEFFIMAAQTELESYTELAEHCRWEAERTLDREVANSLRALAGRYRRMSQRSAITSDAWTRTDR
jgi:hypothetical protein